MNRNFIRLRFRILAFAPTLEVDLESRSLSEISRRSSLMACGLLPLATAVQLQQVDRSHSSQCAGGLGRASSVV